MLEKSLKNTDQKSYIFWFGVSPEDFVYIFKLGHFDLCLRFNKQYLLNTFETSLLLLYIF